METDPVSVITIRASGVVSMAFAKTGLVSLCTIFSEMFPPGDNDLVKMFKDDLANLASQTRRTVELELLQDVEALWLKPILALRIPLYSMHVHRFIALVRVEIQPPVLNKRERWASVNNSIIRTSAQRVITVGSSVW